MKQACQEYEDRIAAALMGELPPREHRGLEKHLVDCEGCRSEHQAMQATLTQLGSLEEVPVPHHFFVEPPQERVGFLQLLNHLSRGAKAFLAASVALLLVVAVSTLGGAQFRAGMGGFEIAFGGSQLPPTGAQLDDEKANRLASEILSAVDQKLGARDQALVAAWRRDVNALGSQLSPYQQTVIRDLMGQQEQRLASEWGRQTGELENGLSNLVVSSYGQLQSRYETNLQELDRILRDFQERGDYQDRQVQYLSDAVLRIAEGVGIRDELDPANRRNPNK